jgi:hypothetical protein
MARRLSNETIISIRERYCGGETQYSIATSVGIVPSAIWRIVRGKSYVDAGGPVSGPRSAAPNTKMGDEQVREMRRRRDETGAPYRELGEAFGVKTDTARLICTGATRRDAGGPLQRPSKPKPRRTLTDAEARAMRDARRDSGATLYRLAVRFGCSQSQARRIIMGESHPDAGGPVESPRSPSDRWCGEAGAIDPFSGCPFSVSRSPRWRTEDAA